MNNFVQPLKTLSAGMPILVNGDSFVTVSQELADAFVEGDTLLTTDDGQLVHITAAHRLTTSRAVEQALTAFTKLSKVADEQIVTFFTTMSSLLNSPDIRSQLEEANAQDVEQARAIGRSTTRLELSEKMLDDMIDGLVEWANMPAGSGQVISTVEHADWQVDLVRAPLGVIGFVFEGRPNVFADACGVIRSGNTVVLRIGRDALGTARAFMNLVINPALAQSGLPEGVVSFVDSPSHEAAWALVSDPRLSLAVVRGSGRAVSMLGSLARSAGNNVSLHGQGGAWMITGNNVNKDWLLDSIVSSLDRKVCNTLNTVVIPRDQASELLPVVISGILAAGSYLGFDSKIHATSEVCTMLNPELLTQMVNVVRANGTFSEPLVERIDEEKIGDEWEWERSPEVTIAFSDSVDHSFELYNRYSSQFVVSYIDDDEAGHRRFEQSVNAPFITNAFTRWVDGQYALNEPELGLGNWESGRLFARGGLLTGNSAYTVRTKATIQDPKQRR